MVESLFRFLGFQWQSPQFLWFLLLLLVLGFWRSRRPRASILFAAESLVEEGLTSPLRLRQNLYRLPPALNYMALILMVMALARPVLRIEEPRQSEGIDLVMVLDVSSSMAATDLDPEGQLRRIDVVRQAAQDFVAGRPEDRMALVSFARYPDLVSPLTLDHEALHAFLEDLQLVEKDGPEDATGIGSAVARACRLLEERESRTGVVVLLTDGEENIATTETPSEIAPLHAAQLAHDMGLRLHAIVVGLGRETAEGQFEAIDTTQVERMAEKTGGRFFSAADQETLQSVYSELSQLETSVLVETRYRMEERYLTFLLSGFCLCLVARFLARSRLEVWP